MPSQYQPKRAQNRPRRHNPLPLLAAAAAVCLGLTLIPSLGRAPEEPTAAAAASRGSGLCLRGLFCARLG